MLPFAIGGTLLWAIVGLTLLPFRDQLAASGRGSWPAICLAGFLIGLPGIAVMLRHDAGRKRRDAGRNQRATPP